MLPHVSIASDNPETTTKVKPSALGKMIASFFKGQDILFKVDSIYYTKDDLCAPDRLWPLMVFAVNESVLRARMSHLGLVPLSSVDTPLRTLNNSVAPLGLQIADKQNKHVMGARSVIDPKSVPAQRIIANLHFLGYFSRQMIEAASRNNNIVDLTPLKTQMLEHLQINQEISTTKARVANPVRV